jgi:hypothetical protein
MSRDQESKLLLNRFFQTLPEREEKSSELLQIWRGSINRKGYFIGICHVHSVGAFGKASKKAHISKTSGYQPPKAEDCFLWLLSSPINALFLQIRS